MVTNPFGREKVTLYREKSGIWKLSWANVGTNEIEGTVPENVEDRLLPFLRDTNGAPKQRVTVTRNQIIQAMRDIDDAKWLLPDVSSAKRVEEFRKYLKKLQGKEKISDDGIAAFLKHDGALRQEMRRAFNSILFDSETK